MVGCASLRLNELRVGTDRFFIAILMDVTDLKAAIEKSAALFEKGLSPMLVINTKGKPTQPAESKA